VQPLKKIGEWENFFIILNGTNSNNCPRELSSVGRDNAYVWGSNPNHHKKKMALITILQPVILIQKDSENSQY
jgi:hypothetical protein